MLERVSCSENGINPKAVYDFVKTCESEGVGIDSFMLLKGGKVVSEGYYKPYTKDTTHVLYSMSKSFTATALGFAIAEGKVKLEDSVTKFFPEYDKLGLSKGITVRHLVTMTAGKFISMAAARQNKDWVKIFFKGFQIAKPGKMFMYVNDNFYMLSAIISKVYGETLVDFLMPRLFEPLGIEKPVWETDKNGVAAGGWGLYMKLEDQAKVMCCYSNGGVYNGKQVIPAEWVKEATKYQVPTVAHGQIEVCMGYGYGFWRSSLPHTYRAYGLHGQNGYVFEDHDTVLMVNSGIARDDALCAKIAKMYETLWDEPVVEYEEKLKILCENLREKETLRPERRNYRLEEEICGKNLHTFSTSLGTMLHPTMTAVMDGPIGKITDFSLEKAGDDLFLNWTEGRTTNKIKLGMNGEYVCTEISLAHITYHAWAKAAWTKGKVLTVFMRIEEGCHLRKLEFDFSSPMLVIRNNAFPDMPNLAAYYMDFAGFPLPKVLDKLLVDVFAPLVMIVGEPNFRIRTNK